jgi:hypothetical protein
LEALIPICKNLEINNVDAALEIIGRTDIKNLSEIEFNKFKEEVGNCFNKFGYQLEIDWDMKKKKYNYITNFILKHFDTKKEYNFLCRIKNWEAVKILDGEDINDLGELIEYLKREQDYTPDDYKKELFLSKRITGFNYDSPEKQTLIFLSLFYASLTEQLIKSLSYHEIEITLKELSHLVSKIIYINEYAPKTGGGEEYFRSCILENNEYGISSIYIQCTRKGRSNKYIAIYPELIDRKIILCRDKHEVINEIKSINPTSLHSIGSTILMATEIANELRIKTKIGYHFWTHFVDLYEGNNIEIIKNIDKHRINRNFETKSKFIDKYVVSDFMLDVYKCLGGLETVAVNYPITTFDLYSINGDIIPHSVTEIKNVLQVNLNEKKGGRIFFDIAKENINKDIKFTGVYSERTNDSDLAKTIEDGKNSRFNNVQVLDFTEKEELFRYSDLIMIPSLVDETFSRIAFEAMIRGKIIITTKNGNLKYLNAGGIFLEEVNDFKVALDFLESEINLDEHLRMQKLKIDTIKSAVVDNFKRSMGETSYFKKTNIGIMSQIGPSGLGKLTQHIFEVFQNLGFSTYVLAALPYEYMGSKEYYDIQAEYSQIYKSNIHKSLNYRETITDFEINNFIESFSINMLIIPEVVNIENWKRLYNLNWNNLSLVSIPMLEIVNLKELMYYSHLTHNIHVTKISFETFKKYGIGDNVFVGHAMKPVAMPFVEDKSEILRLVFVGGRNAFKRKNLEKFLETFLHVAQKRKDLHLTVSLSKSELIKVEQKYKLIDESQIKFKVGDLTNEELDNLITESDLGILLSKSEGLGLGFWDFNCRGIPVLTHNGYPHAENSEIGKNHNFEIAAKPQPLSDMATGIFMEFDFDKSELIQFLENITKDKLTQSKKALRKIDFTKQFTEYQVRILKSLNVQYTTVKYETGLQKISSRYNILKQLIRNIPLGQVKKIMISRSYVYDGRNISIFQSYFTYRSLIKVMIEKSPILQRNAKTIRTYLLRFVKILNKF